MNQNRWTMGVCEPSGHWMVWTLPGPYKNIELLPGFGVQLSGRTNVPYSEGSWV